MRQTLLGEEHVLGPAEANALSAVLPGALGVLWRIRVGPDLETAGLVRPPQEYVQLLQLVGAGSQRGNLAQEDLAGGPVDADDVTLPDRDPTGRRGAVRHVEVQLLATHDAGLTQAAGHHGCVARHAATAGQDTLGLDDAVHVVGARLRTDQEHGLS